VAEGRYEEAEDVLDGLLSAGIPAANYLYILNALSEGAPPSPKAEGVIEYLEGLAGEELADLRSAGGLWTLGIWYHALLKEAENVAERSLGLTKLRAVSAALETVAEESKRAEDALLSELVAIHLETAESRSRADTLQLIDRLRELTPTEGRVALTASVWQTLSRERLTLARLLLAAGDSSGAYRQAEVVEWLAAPVSLLYLRPSLEMRLELSSKLGLEDESLELTQRLEGLCGDISAAACPNPPIR
jgi:hypothetical protein